MDKKHALDDMSRIQRFPYERHFMLRFAVHFSFQVSEILLLFNLN